MTPAVSQTDDPAKLALAQWLSRLHEAAGGNVSALARTLGTDRKNVYRWLDGSNEPTATALLQLLPALGVELKPKPPDEIPRPLNVELADVRERVEAVEAAVVAQGIVLHDIAQSTAALLLVAREAPASALPEQNTRP